ncbi:DMT family transporter [Massilia forsythiae]|uniref:DMT family transporter n=1 Tax=Massilia forsythiae TaxID=2728020 RepID=A0A7Z2VUS5_9BURK|nr:DMT family transporter [Massilia forsythiae]QJD99630.1 DMT family transporter [Massilia forsythiae]
MKQNYLSGVIFCLIATLSWGAMFPVMTSALAHVDPFHFTAARYTIAGLAFAILLLYKEGIHAFHLKGERVVLAWLLGTAGFAGFGFLVFLGQQLAGPSGALTASIVMATMPLLGVLANWVIRGVKPARATLGFISMSFVGVLLVITEGNFNALLNRPSSFAAYLPLLAGALCWVVYTIGAGFFPGWSAYRYTTLTTLLGLTSVFAVTLVLDLTHAIQPPSVADTVTVLPHLLYMALIAGMVGVLCWNMGNKIVTPLNGVLFMDVVPVTAFIISALTGVVPHQVQVCGAVVTATALVLNNLYQRRQLALHARLATRPA